MEKQTNNGYRSQVSRELGSIDVKITSIGKNVEDLKNYIQSYEERIRCIEDWKLTITTKVGVIALVVSGLFSLILIFLDKII